MNELIEKFFFNHENLEKAATILEKYPIKKSQSALIPLLMLAQEQNKGWVSQSVIEFIAQFLGLHPMKVHEVASFYTMLNLKPVGKYHLQVCTTTPCWLNGSDKIVSACKNKLGIELGETTVDQQFTLTEIECLAACVYAPVVQINNDYYEKISPDQIIQIIDKFKLDK